jgi:CAAX protease family protein
VPAAVALYAALFAAAWGWRSLLRGEPLLFASEAEARAGLHLARDLALGSACALPVVLASRLAEARSAWGRRLAAELGTAVGPLSRRACLALALASGIAEEAFFRGALQPRVGLAAASLIFGLAHWPVTRGLRPWTAWAFATGVGLGALFEVSGSLVAPATAHVLVNAVGLLDLAGRARRQGLGAA